MGTASLKSIMLDPVFDKLSLADQAEAMRRAGASDEVLSDWVGLNAKGPTISAAPSPGPGGFEDTSSDVKRILSTYHEPNRARDVLPKLALVAATAPLVEVPAITAGGLAALRGLSHANKARKVVGVGLKTAGAAGVGVLADQALQAVGVPPGVSEAVLAVGGLSSRPGRTFVRRALRGLVGGAETAAAPTAARTAPAVAEAVAPAAAEAAPAVAATTPSAAAPLTRGATALAPEVSQTISKAEEIAAKIVQWKTQNKWSGAQMESALRNVYGISPKDGREMIRRVLEAQGVSPLQAPRIEVGAQKVGRSVGMTKEEVRQAAGPVLDEAVGEASPILPKKALQSIIDTMKAMPMAEREAYVARATSGKAKWQIENIRRTLEHLGLLLPLGAAGAAAARQ